ATSQNRDRPAATVASETAGLMMLRESADLPLWGNLNRSDRVVLYVRYGASSTQPPLAKASARSSPAPSSAGSRSHPPQRRSPLYRLTPTGITTGIPSVAQPNVGTMPVVIRSCSVTLDPTADDEDDSG